MNKAFTLIELAIVVVILGLITVGVLGAQSLIESAKRQAIVKEFQQYNLAINAYYLEYDAIPGDHSTASEWLPGADNGDGDKRIDGVTPVQESRFFWQHLTLAEIIPGEYGMTLWSSLIKPDVPTTVLGEDTGWYIFYSGVAGHGWKFSDTPIYGKRGNLMGTGSTRGDSWLDGGTSTGREARKIDEKIDDGKAAEGKFFAIKGRIRGSVWDSGCVDQEPLYQGIDVTYDLTSDQKSCHLVFWLD
jgi:prepilin-type N-terminal cleavage/methylation domain-containing protein